MTQSTARSNAQKVVEVNAIENRRVLMKLTSKAADAIAIRDSHVLDKTRFQRKLKFTVVTTSVLRETNTLPS